MITVVCVYNNKVALEECLLRSIQRQTCQPELLLLDNTDARFASAAQALNHGADGANGDYLMFVHQDVELGSSSWFSDAEKMMEGIPDLGVAAVAGTSRSRHGGLEVVTNITHGIPPRPTGSRHPKNPEKVQTVDECLVIVPANVFKSLQFDEELRDGYHLYAVDYSLSVARLGFGAYVIPMPAYHRSQGSANRSSIRTILSLGPYPHAYYETLARLLRKHRANTRWIYTTTGRWNTSRPLVLQRLMEIPRHLGYRLGERALGNTGAFRRLRESD